MPLSAVAQVLGAENSLVMGRLFAHRVVVVIEPSPSPRIPLFRDGTASWHPEYLDEHLFWISYLSAFFTDSDAARLLLGPDADAAQQFNQAIFDAEDFPVFSVPLGDGRRIDVVYDTIPDDSGISFWIYEPSRPEPRSKGDAHDGASEFMSWPEIVSEMNRDRDHYCRLLMLLPLLDRDTVVPTAVDVLAEAFTMVTAVDDPVGLADLLLRQDP